MSETITLTDTHKKLLNLNDDNKFLLPDNTELLSLNDNTLTLTDEFLKRKVPDVWRYNLVKKDDELILNQCFDNFSPSSYTLSNLHEEKEVNAGIELTPTDSDGDSQIFKELENSKKIIILLESPYKDEYDESFNPIAPAMGIIGTSFDEYLIEVLKDPKNIKLNNGTYRILLVNPVQNQASLDYFCNSRSLNKVLRDKVWKKLFTRLNTGNKNEFITRLKSYSPNIIINCCTYGLKDKVSKIIRKNIISQDVLLYETVSHPSSWSKEKNRAMKKY